MATFDPNDVEVVSGSKTFDPSEVEVVPEAPAFMAGKGGGFDEDVQLAPTKQDIDIPSSSGFSPYAAPFLNDLRTSGQNTEALKTAGSIAGGELGAVGIGAIPAVRAAALGARVLPKVGAGAAIGAGAGAGSAAGGGDIKGVPRAAATGALLGAAGPALEAVATKLSPAASEREIERAATAYGEGASRKARKGLERDSDAANLREVLATKPELVKAATEKPAQQIIAAENVARDAGKRLRKIFREQEPIAAALNLEHGINSNAVVANMKSRASKLADGDVVERKTAKALNDLAEEFNAAYSGQNVKAAKLRQDQTAYQRLGYATTREPDAQPAIEAAREAQKVIGDSVVKHLTGMPYNEALAHAEANPDSVAGRLFQANKEVSVANKIKAAAESKIGSNAGAPYRGSKLIHGALHTATAIGATAAGVLHQPLAAGAMLGVDAAITGAPYVLRALDGAVIRLANKPLNPAIEKYAQRLVNMGIKANAVDSAIRRLNSEAPENAGP